ncbi:MAG: tripartite tricarboxylate transporter substrate-binding protein [Pseudolabrys sp.]
MSFAFMVAMTFTPAQGDAYPSKPVRIIVPYGAGGIADVTMRRVAQDLSKRFGQQFFIENRPGAGGVVGMQTAREAPADGYTLVMVGGGLAIAKALFKSLPYNIETDFIPISTTASYGLVITTKADSPYKTIKDVIANAKAHPGTLNFGTINAGSTQNLSAELFRAMAGLEVTIVPYKTTPDLANAVLRGDVDIAFEYFVGFAYCQWANDCARDDRTRPRQQPTRRSNRDRRWSAWLRGDKLEWPCGHRGNACRYCCAAQPRCGRSTQVT